MKFASKPKLPDPVVGVTVQVGNIASGSSKLTLGQSSEVVEVTGSAVAVNTEQATVQGVLSTQQIEIFPINGRNFLILPSSNRRTDSGWRQL